MKKQIASLAVVLAVGLGGCAELKKIEGAAQLATTTIDNPVTPERMYEAESGATVVVSGLVGYRRTCLAKPRIIPKSCRGVIEAIQPYTKQAEVQLPVLRKFVKENDQINAVQVYNLIMDSVNSAKSLMTQNNVPIPIAGAQ